MTPEKLKIEIYRLVQKYGEATVDERVIEGSYKARLRVGDFSINDEMERLAKEQGWAVSYNRKLPQVTFKPI